MAIKVLIPQVGNESKSPPQDWKRSEQMNPWYRWINPAVWPIAVKLSAMLLLAALVPMNVTAYYNLRGSLASVKKTAYQNLELLAASTANRLDQLIIDKLLRSLIV